MSAETKRGDSCNEGGKNGQQARLACEIRDYNKGQREKPEFGGSVLAEGPDGAGEFFSIGTYALIEIAHPNNPGMKGNGTVGRHQRRSDREEVKAAEAEDK